MEQGDRRSKVDGQLETLDDLSEAVHYNRWIYGMMEPYLGDHVLELGCGIGNITALLAEGRKVLAVDIHKGYLQQARARLRDSRNVFFKKIDLEKDLLSLRNFKPDTIVCVNVFEHIEGDVLFLRECFKILRPGGRLLIFVPALQVLFGSMDVQYGHFRRYSKHELGAKAASCGFSALTCRYLNLLGVLGWWWNGKILKRSIVPRAQILLYDQIIRWIAPIEKWFPKPIGLSLFFAGQKSSEIKRHEK